MRDLGGVFSNDGITVVLDLRTMSIGLSMNAGPWMVLGGLIVVRPCLRMLKADVRSARGVCGGLITVGEDAEALGAGVGGVGVGGVSTGSGAATAAVEGRALLDLRCVAGEGI